MTPGGVRDAGGTERPADVLVLATGFKSHDFVAPMEVVGREGRTLAEEWGEVARAYLGLSVPGFPNMFLLDGPNTNGGTGSVIYTLEAGVEHVIAALRELDRADAEPDRGAPRGGRAVRRRAARRPRRDRLAQRLHELVRRRERQRPEPVAVAVERVPPPRRAAGARRLQLGDVGDQGPRRDEPSLTPQPTNRRSRRRTSAPSSATASPATWGSSRWRSRTATRAAGSSSTSATCTPAATSTAASGRRSATPSPPGRPSATSRRATTSRRSS